MALCQPFKADTVLTLFNISSLSQKPHIFCSSGREGNQRLYSAIIFNLFSSALTIVQAVLRVTDHFNE